MMMTLRVALLGCIVVVVSQILPSCKAFFLAQRNPNRAAACRTVLKAAGELDLVTEMRCQWVAAKLCQNQAPRSAKIYLQLGTRDAQALIWTPEASEQLLTSSLEKDGRLTEQAKMALMQTKQEKPLDVGETVPVILNQRADQLSETEDESVDVVLSFTAAEMMKENGLDWRDSILESVRVLKPGGRLLFVEPPLLEKEAYVDFLESLKYKVKKEGGDGDGETKSPVFDVSWDEVNLVIKPHLAGVAIKNADPIQLEQQEQDRLADLSISVFESGVAKKKKKKKKKDTDKDGEDDGDKKSE